MKTIFLCIDGMEERGAPARGFPHAGLAAHGTVRTVPPGAQADSLGCILRLLGTLDNELPEGRAAIEALAAGLPLAADDAVLRCTLCGLDGAGRLAPPPPDAAARLAGAQLTLPAAWTLLPLSDYRALLRVRGGAAALTALSTEPPHQHFGEAAMDCLPRGSAFGDALAAFAEQSAARLPGCILLPWGQAAPRALRPFAARTGLRGAAVCRADVVRGIARALGLACPDVLGATGDVDTDLAAKRRAAEALAEEYPFVFVHVGGCDEAAHRRDAAGKEAFLRRVQHELLLPLLRAKGADGRVLVCADHGASCRTGAHETGPVRFWLYGRAEQARAYTFEDAGAPLRLLTRQEA